MLQPLADLAGAYAHDAVVVQVGIGVSPEHFDADGALFQAAPVALERLVYGKSQERLAALAPMKGAAFQ